MVLCECRAAARPHADELAGLVMEEQERLAVGQVVGNLLDQVIGVPVGDDEVLVSIEIEIIELDAPAAVHLGGSRDAAGTGGILKREVAPIAIDRKTLAVEVRNEQVLEAVIVKVRCVHTHPGPGCAVGTVGYAGIESDLPESAVPVVEEQKIRNGIVGDEKIEKSVVVDVGRDRAECFALVPPNSGGGADIGECAVPIVAVQAAGPRIIAILLIASCCLLPM